MNGGTFPAAARRVAELAVGVFGDGLRVRLMRAARLVSSLSGERVTVLTVAADAVASDSELVVAGYMVGRLPAGTELEIGALDGTYTLEAEAAFSSGDAVTLRLANPLADDVAEGDAVSIVSQFVSRWLRVLIADAIETRETEAGRQVSRTFHVVADTQAAPVPGDYLEDGGKVWMIESVGANEPAGAAKAIRWALVAVRGADS